MAEAAGPATNFTRALAGADAFNLTSHASPVALELPVTAAHPRVPWSDLPLKPRPRGGRSRHLFDVIPDVNLGDLDKPALLDIIGAKRFNDLPDGIHNKTDETHDYDLQIAFFQHPSQAEIYTVVKHITFKQDNVTASRLDRMIVGSAYVLNWGESNHRSFRKALQKVWVDMGGFQINHLSLEAADPSSNARDAGFMTATEVNMAYDFIEAQWNQGKIGMGGTSQLRWIALQMGDPTSPLRKMKKADIKEALATMQTTGSLADVHHEYPLTMMHIAVWFRPIALQIFAALFSYPANNNISSYKSCEKNTIRSPNPTNTADPADPSTHPGPTRDPPGTNKQIFGPLAGGAQRQMQLPHVSELRRQPA